MSKHGWKVKEEKASLGPHLAIVNLPEGQRRKSPKVRERTTLMNYD